MKDICLLSDAESRAITAENPTGEKGRGGLATEGDGAAAARELGPGWKVSPCRTVQPGETLVLADVGGPGRIRHIWIADGCKADRRLVIRFYWDGAEKPSVEAPLGDFFACALHATEPGTLVSNPVCVNPRRALNCWWEMPFRTHARVTLESLHDEPVTVYWQIDYEAGEQPAGAAYFHAQFRRTDGVPERGVHTILDGVRGRGHYVGTYALWGVHADGWWGEGEVKFHLDGDRDGCTICGTGTEDYFLGAWGFDDGGYREYCTPWSGLAHIRRPDGLYKAVPRFSLYRWHIPDPIRFREDIRVTVQDLGWRSGGRYLSRRDDVSTVAYWYQSEPFTDFPPFPSRDALEIV